MEKEDLQEKIEVLSEETREIRCIIADQLHQLLDEAEYDPNAQVDQDTFLVYSLPEEERRSRAKTILLHKDGCLIASPHSLRKLFRRYGFSNGIYDWKVYQAAMLKLIEHPKKNCPYFTAFQVFCSINSDLFINLSLVDGYKSIGKESPHVNTRIFGCDLIIDASLTYSMFRNHVQLALCWFMTYRCALSSLYEQDRFKVNINNLPIKISTFIDNELLFSKHKHRNISKREWDLRIGYHMLLEPLIKLFKLNEKAVERFFISRLEWRKVGNTKLESEEEVE